MNPDNSPSTDWIESTRSVIAKRKLRWIDALVLVAGYLALEWVSFFHPLHGLNITPWSPAPALGLVFILRFGVKVVPLIALAIFLSDVWSRNLPVPLSFLLGVLLAAGYAAIGEVLRRRLQSDEIFSTREAFLTWALIVAVGTLIISAVFVSMLTGFGWLPQSDWSAAFVRHWIGDCVGILVTMPLFWMVYGERGRATLKLLLTQGETAAILVASMAALWISFRFGADAQFKYLYVLFLPIAWAAARQGLAGAILIATVIQVGIIFFVNRPAFSAISVLEIQMLTLVQAGLGLFVGVIIDEQRRVSSELRHTLRLAAAGEMAGALAHELNQPLTALSAYAAACDKLLEQNDTGVDRVRDAMRRIVAESERAGEVLSRLRDFFRAGSTRLEPVQLRELLNASVTAFETRAQKLGITLELGAVPECELLADRLQIEVVIRNLLSNAFDAVAGEPPTQRRVHVSAMMEAPGRVRVQVEDSGPGLSPTTVAHLFEPFETTKSSGLGLGLAISRAIVHAHGGNLWTEVGDHGVFKLVLLVEGSLLHDNA